MNTTALAQCLRTSLAATLIMFAIGASAQSETIIHTFTGGTDGSIPEGGLVSDSKDNLYGTTSGGGLSGGGTVFELSPSSDGTWSEQVLHNFAYGGDGGFPFGGVVFDSKGNLYGTTAFGGTSEGTVFQLVPGANGTWTENILYNFTGASDGGNPYSGVVLDRAGNVYGVTAGGGAFEFGTVFELIAGSNGTWTEKVLHSFTGGNDGAAPSYGTLILDGAGNIYGVTGQGGFHDYGVAYELAPGAGGSWTEKVLHAFTGGAGGSGPAGGLILDGSGSLYGVSAYSAFQLTPGSDGSWAEKSLYDFVGGSDGAYPEAQLIFDKNGNLYGTTNTGGLHRGTVFKLSSTSNGLWKEKVLHRFAPDGTDGADPFSGALVQDSTGNLYGTTPGGGTSSAGVVFEVKP
jgi:uncharacterized repeat protein (TIGR03803 family)